MMTFKDFIKKEWNIDMPENPNGTWFDENRLSMVVKCTCCGMSMVSPNAMIDEAGYTYCKSCAEME